jgi:AcrR family transcriptional regulator
MTQGHEIDRAFFLEVISVGEKSVQKKKYILETARKVFMERGFKNVTMKDIVDACAISRGGLYLYYSSTEELFLDVLKAESEGALPEKATPADIMQAFFNAWKSELLSEKESLTAATYEYAFLSEENGARTYLKTRFEESVRLVSRLLIAGTRTGQFSVSDPYTTARNIMFALEGLRISVGTMEISERTIEGELKFLMQELSSGRQDG